MKKVALLLFTFLAPYHLFAQEYPSAHKEALVRHLQMGQMNQDELNRQKFEYENNKKWDTEFKKQVRGVSSVIQSNTKIIKFKNPVIEISVE